MPLSRSARTTRSQRRRALNLAPTELRTALEDISEEVVTFTDIVFSFPLPPLPTPSTLSRSPCGTTTTSGSKSPSPAPTSSSLPSSPDSQTACLPLTPSSSDDDFSLPLPALNPKRASIKPLVINKHDRPMVFPTIDRSEESDSDESDSEWYTREFSQVLTFNSQHTAPISFPAAHRDSVWIAPALDSPLSPSERKRRKSSGIRFSPVVDVVAPPVPSIPSQYLSAPKCAKTISITTPRRPPPRMSMPDDACSAFSLSLYTDDTVEPEPSSLSIYSQDSVCMGARKDFEDGRVEEEVEFPEDFEVQVDCPMMLPLSLPGTPIDFEADIAQELEEMWMKEFGPVKSSSSTEEQGLGVGFILEEDDGVDEAAPVTYIPTHRIICTSPSPPPPTVPTHLPAIVSTPLPSPPASPTSSALPPIMFPPLPPSSAPAAPTRPRRLSSLSIMSDISFPPSPPAYYRNLGTEENGQFCNEDFDERKHGLKSKWSSSTLASVREQHAASPGSSKFPGASKLKMHSQDAYNPLSLTGRRSYDRVSSSPSR
ncbi:hypothetical protein AN958_12434 [Leucoagaricus sp. SymC.cos]|nr:hypothetical protein AN958_12434 [Leucoagaricus sp. SymC.cos]